MEALSAIRIAARHVRKCELRQRDHLEDICLENILGHIQIGVHKVLVHVLLRRIVD